jgi:hypothetical protein
MRDKRTIVELQGWAAGGRRRRRGAKKCFDSLEGGKNSILKLLFGHVCDGKMSLKPYFFCSL